MARSKSSARRNVNTEIEALKEQLEHLATLVDRYRDEKDATVAADVVAKARDFISRAREATVETADQTLESLVSSSQELATAARSSASDAIDDVSATIAKNPLTAALAAAGVGLFLGFAMRRD